MDTVVLGDLGLYLVVGFGWFWFGVGVDCGFRGFGASGLVVWVGCAYWLVDVLGWVVFV